MTSEDNEDIVRHVIYNTGDLLLQAKDDFGVVKAFYRVSSTELMKHSGYYKKLLRSSFSDGLHFKKEKERLYVIYGTDLAKVPFPEIPIVSLPFPIGFTREKIVLTAFKLFLQAIHSKQSTELEDEQGDWLLMGLSTNIDLFAHVAAIADQLDASSVIRYVAEEVLKVQPMCTKKPQKGDHDSERYWRQLLYIAYLQRQSEAFKWISGAMILHGFDNIDDREPEAPWMNLPNNIEEEIAIRRDGVFNTIASIPNALLKPYMQIDKSRPPICKLGWSNSPACDSFQLGESIRWLCRRKLASPNLSLVFSVPDDEDLALPQGTPKATIKILKEFPDYQIDVNHHRCGIKGKLIQVLDTLERMVNRPQQVGLCLDCWRTADCVQFSWSLQRGADSTPYRGNLAQDIAAAQKTKGKRVQTKVGSDTQQEVYEAIATSIRTANAHNIATGVARVRAQVNGTAAPARIATNPNTVGSISPVSTASSQEEFQESQPKVNHCTLVSEHKLYAKVFAPERWTEKEWLSGEESVSITADTPVHSPRK